LIKQLLGAPVQIYIKTHTQRLTFTMLSIKTCCLKTRFFIGFGAVFTRLRAGKNNRLQQA